VHNYASYLGVADLAAAAIHADRRMEGSHVIERALSRLGGRASARIEQLIARARGILADPSNSGAHFDRALADPAGDQWPFERAQLRLDYAEWLRRRRRINDAKPVLTEALGTFQRLEARSSAQRAQAELRACGVTDIGAPSEFDALGELTPQQRQIVRLASHGLTDREIGDRLFLSPRTVSSHLYRSYPKLGVASRHQLRDVIARASTQPQRTKAPEARRFGKCLTVSLEPTSAHVRDLETCYPRLRRRRAGYLGFRTQGPDLARAVTCAVGRRELLLVTYTWRGSHPSGRVGDGLKISGPPKRGSPIA